MLYFKMRGSQGDVYDVEFERNGDGVLMACSCEAGQRGIHCHHRIELLRGDVTALVSDNPDDVARLQTMIVGTKLAAEIHTLTEAEAVQAAAKAVRDRSMHAIDRLLMQA